jgi:hypothetical protein
MLTYALIGAFIGAMITIITVSKAKGSSDKRMRALETQGPGAARALLDTQIPPVDDLPMSKILEQKERMASLAMMGDVASLEREAPRHRGALTSIVQVNAMAMLGIAFRAPDKRAQAVAELERLATQMETEGGALMGLVKKKTRAMAHLGRGLLGEPIHVDQHLVIQQLTKEPNATGLLVAAAWAEALRLTGQQARAEEVMAGVRAKTRAFG